MKLEKKLIVCSILAIAIGIASIVPLAFFMSAKAQTSLDDQPQLNIKINIPYAYISNYWDNSSAVNNTYGWVYSIVFQGSPNFDPNTVNPDAVYEYYQVEVSSEKGSIGNLTYSTYAKFNDSKPLDFNFYYQNQWFNSSESNLSKDSTGLALWGNGTSLGYKTGPGEDWDRSLGQPETLFITVQRQGWIIISNDNSTVTHLANPDVILKIQLQKHGDGFMYNNIFTEDELSQINPLMPQLKLFK